MKISRAGLDLIRRWEGCRLVAYKCSAGVWTIGYGLTSAAGLVAVKEGMRITQAQAEEYLVASLVKYEAAVSKALARSPTQNQFDAMVSLCFNIGPGAFGQSSLVKLFNKGDLQGAADAFLSWRKAGGKVLPGLEARRREERQMFLKPAPKAVELPRLTPEPVTRIPVFNAATDAPRPSLWARFIAWWRS